jgi:hypothetical protein
MTTPVSIASNALLMVGDKPIASLEEGTDRARLCANLWPTVRDSVLRSHTWNCAIKRELLMPLAQAPKFDWSYAFTLPGDCLRILSVGERNAEDEWEVQGDVIAVDFAPCMLRYVFRNEVPATYDAMLVDLLTVTMAARMAYALTQSATLAQSLKDEAVALARRARAVDGQDDTPLTLGDNPLRDARMRI